MYKKTQKQNKTISSHFRFPHFLSKQTGNKKYIYIKKQHNLERKREGGTDDVGVLGVDGEASVISQRKA